jgi:hypothetical protein
MQATELIQNEIAKVLSTNDLYNSYRPRWRYLLESYLGGDEYRRAGHLTRYATESNAEYQARLLATPLQNHCASVTSVYTSFLFREQPHRDLGSIENNSQITDFLRDCDYEGRTLDHFMKDLSTWVSVFGHAWMIVSKPNVGAVTAADEQMIGNRPYLSMLTPLVVTDWQWRRGPTGKYELDYLKYIEEVNGDIHTVKEWTPEMVKTSIVDESRNEYVESPTVEENELGIIPAVLAYNKRSSVRGIGVSDLKDIADQQRFIYNALSEVDQSIRLNTHPSLVKTENTQAGIGAGSVIHVDESMDPALKPYLLEFSGSSIDSIYESIRDAVSSIDKMANTGAVRATESRTMSGIAMETEFQMLNARLSEKANSLELAEEQMWQIWALYMNVDWNGTIDYPTSFNIRDAKHDLEFYLLAQTANVPSETHRKQLHKQIAEVSVENPEVINDIRKEIETSSTGTFEMNLQTDQELEFEPHIMVSPDGEMVIARTEAEHLELAEQGYTHV